MHVKWIWPPFFFKARFHNLEVPLVFSIISIAPVTKVPKETGNFQGSAASVVNSLPAHIRNILKDKSDTLIVTQLSLSSKLLIDETSI